MNKINIIKKNFLRNLSLSQYINQRILFTLRFLQDSNKQKEELQKRQLNELLMYLIILFGAIILILIGYQVFKKCAKKRAEREIILEYEYYNNYLDSISAASQDERNVYSLNGKAMNKYKVSELESYNDQNNNSFDYNHEERMEKIRKKYGNKMLIKILINQQIENVIYNKKLGLEYGDKCTICFNNFIDNLEIYRTPCEHIFHKDCFNKYLKKINKKNKLTCPNCNQNLLLNKKFFKLRKEIRNNELNKIKVKKDIFDYNKNFETEKKQIMEVSTGDNNKNVEIVNVNINNNMNNNETVMNNKNIDTIFILKKKKIGINRNKIIKHAATVDNNKKRNIYNPNENIELNKIKKDKKEEEEMYIPNIDENDVEIFKESINQLNNGNTKNTESNLININIKDKKKKINHEKIKFSDIENEMNNNQIDSQDFNSNRELFGNKIIFNKVD